MGCKKISKQGYLRSPSAFVQGVTDLAYPILDGDSAVASLTVPYIDRIPEEVSIDQVLVELEKAAAEISKAITYGIARKF